MKCHLEDLPDGYPLARILELYALRILENEEQKERIDNDRMKD